MSDKNKIQKPDLNEAAGIKDGRDVTRTLSGFVLKPTDSLLASKGGQYKIYKEVFADDQVKSCLEQRISAVVAREWIVEPGADDGPSRDAAEWLKAQLNAVAWDEVTRKMLYGLHYGYSVAELIYEVQDNKIGLNAIKVRDRERFVFDLDGTPRLRTKAEPQNGEALPPNKFWHFSCGADHDDEPYGMGLGHWLYWPTYFKRHGIKSWLVFLEKLGTPPLVGKYPRGATKQEKETLLNALLALQSDGAIIIPDGMATELLEAARSATPDFSTLTDKMNAAISKVVLGQTMTTDDGSSQSQANVHFNVRADIVKADADLVCASFNRQAVKWLTNWNFANATPPRVWRRVEDEPDMAAMAARDKNIHDMGFKPTLAHIQENYGGEWVERQEPTPIAPLPAPTPNDPAFAEGDGAPSAADEAIAAILENEGWEPVGEIMDGLADKIAGAKSLAEAEEILTAHFGRMDMKAFADQLARALFVARVMGAGGLELDE